MKSKDEIKEFFESLYDSIEDIRNEVLYDTSSYEPNDVLNIIDRITDKMDNTLMTFLDAGVGKTTVSYDVANDDIER